MVDFASSLYLGLTHPSGSLAPWEQLTTGRPAALAEPPGNNHLKQQFAQLVGLERATLGTSSFHLFWDLFGLFPNHDGQVCVDTGVYPTARWGIERATGRGALVRTFPHHDAEGLLRLLWQGRGREQLVVTDGFCPDCGKPAPLSDYLEAARRYGARLVIDDTQALGVLGKTPGPGHPYGRGGGGILPYTNNSGADVFLVASLAKGFGAPIAMLAGNAKDIADFEAKSDTRVHCSPPSLAALNAAKQALLINQTRGDDLRLRLWALVHHFRRSLVDVGLLTEGGAFPVQTLRQVEGLEAPLLYQRLRRQGIQAVLRKSRMTQRSKLSLILTASHTARDIDWVTEALAYASDISPWKELKYVS